MFVDVAHLPFQLRSSRHCHYLIVRDGSQEFWQSTQYLSELLEPVVGRSLPVVVDLLECRIGDLWTIVKLCEFGKSIKERGQVILYILAPERHSELLTEMLNQQEITIIQSPSRSSCHCPQQ